MPSGRNGANKSVFFNVPFDLSYEPLFVALIAAVVVLGRTPRCVLEIPETGQGRLSRILVLLRSCATSIHDLSRVGSPVRFNMPFELGIAFALSRLQARHKFIMLEAKRHRLQRTLSDMNGIDPLIHSGKAGHTISCVLSHLGKTRGNPPVQQVQRLYQVLWKVVPSFKSTHARTNIYSRGIFGELVDGATRLAEKDGLIKP